MLAEIPQEEFSNCMDAVAAEVLELAEITEPPVNALSIADRLGMTVAWDERQEVRGRYVRLNTGGPSGMPTILLRPEPRPERCQWAVAHEIGEHVTYRVFVALGVDPRELGPMARESIANQLAGRLLLPTAWFSVDASRCAWDLFELKARYRTASHELITRRMLELPSLAIITIFDQGRIYFRQSNVPGHVPRLSSVESGCWREVHERGQPSQADHGTLIVQGWPIHEPQWKREILRTEVDLELL